MNWAYRDPVVQANLRHHIVSHQNWMYCDNDEIEKVNDECTNVKRNIKSGLPRQEPLWIQRFAVCFRSDHYAYHPHGLSASTTSGPQSGKSSFLFRPIVSGAALARPSRNSQFIVLRALAIVAWSKYFVNMSAGFSVPRIFSSKTLSVLVCSWTQRSQVCKCRIFPRPRLLEIPIAAVASE